MASGATRPRTRAYVAIELGPSEEVDFFAEYEIHEISLTGETASRVGVEKQTGISPELPIARRDVTGDGQLETVTDDGCRTRILAGDGAEIVGSALRCCGC